MDQQLSITLNSKSIKKNIFPTNSMFFYLNNSQWCTKKHIFDWKVSLLLHMSQWMARAFSHFHHVRRSSVFFPDDPILYNTLDSNLWKAIYRSFEHTLTAIDWSIWVMFFWWADCSHRLCQYKAAFAYFWDKIWCSRLFNETCEDSKGISTASEILFYHHNVIQLE